MELSYLQKECLIKMKKLMKSNLLTNNHQWILNLLEVLKIGLITGKVSSRLEDAPTCNQREWKKKMLKLIWIN